MSTAVFHLVLPWARPPLTANASGGHWSASASAVKDVRDDTTRIARSLKLRPVSGPAMVFLSWYPGSNRVADSDNIAPTLKRVIDGLRLANVFADDSSTHIVFSGQRVVPLKLDPWKSKKPRLVVSVYLSDHAPSFPLPHPAPAMPATLTRIDHF